MTGSAFFRRKIDVDEFDNSEGISLGKVDWENVVETQSCGFAVSWVPDNGDCDLRI